MFDSVPTALPDEETTHVEIPPMSVEFEVTTVFVRDWTVMQAIAGESTIRAQIPSAMETLQMAAFREEAVPFPVEEAIESKFAALCRLVNLAEADGWNLTTTDYDGPEVAVLMTDPDGCGYPTAIRFMVSRWPDFKLWFEDRVRDGFRRLRPLASEHREFLLQFNETLHHHQHADDGSQVIVFSDF